MGEYDVETIQRNKTHRVFAMVAAFAFLSFLLTVTSCVTYSNKIAENVIVEGMKTGIDPRAIKCGWSGWQEGDAVCLLQMNQKTQVDKLLETH